MNFKALVIVLSLLFCLIVNNRCVSSDANAISKELKTMEKEIPLPYHEDLLQFVERYRGRELPEAFTKYESYIETELLQRNIPVEMKYLPISLSGMQLDYQKEDRCGVWALPTLVALHYGLTVDDCHDERFSVEASTKAALDYLSELQLKYNDWWHSILAFSNSPSSLQHVLVEYGNSLSLWDIYEKHLVPHPEVICNFIACFLAYHDHVTELHPSEGDSMIAFSQPISVQLLAKETNLSVEQIKTMNPVFRTDVFVPLEGYSLVLPKANVKDFTSMEQRLYEETAKAKPIVEEKVETAVVEEKPAEVVQPAKQEKVVTHKVKLGETLTSIAKKHHVTISELIEWNHLESDFIRDGQELIIKK